MEITARHSVDAAAWNAEIACSPFGTFYQTTYYTEYARTIGYEPLFVRVHDNGRFLASLVLYETSPLHPVLAGLPFAGITYPIARRTFPVLIWRYGPVPAPDLPEEERRAAFESLASWIADYARRRRAPVTSGVPHPLADPPAAFEKVGFASKPWGTFLIDLSQSQETLWSNVDKAARKLVERTRERGVEVVEARNEADLHAYLDVINESRRRAGLILYPYSNVLWKVLQSSSTGAVLLARKGDDVLAGLSVTWFNGYVNEWGAGTSQKAIDEKLYAGDVLKWHVIEEGKRRGFRYYDLTGVNPNPKDEKEAGILRFKAKWGGQLTRYNEYSLGIKRKRDAILRAAKKVGGKAR